MTLIATSQSDSPAEPGLPVARPLHGVGHHLLVERDQQPGLFGDVQERIRLEQSLLGVADPHERLGAREEAGAEVEDRLVLDDDPFLVERPQQHPLGAHPPDRPGPQLLVEDVHAVAPAVLGPVQREVRLLEQVVGAAFGVRGPRDPDAQRADVLLLTELERLAPGFDDPPSELHGGVFALHALGEDHELVTAQTGQRVGGPEVVREPLRHLREHRVSHPVPERVVDDLEPIEVEVEHDQQTRPSAQPAERLMQPVHEDGAVGHPRQRVRERAALEGLLRLAAVLDVADRRHDQVLTVGRDAARRRLAPAVRAVATQEPPRGGRSPRRPVSCLPTACTDWMSSGCTNSSRRRPSSAAGAQPNRRRLALETYRKIPSAVATVLTSAEPAVKD